ncbi:hypothetical protein [Larkinella harenae]
MKLFVIWQKVRFAFQRDRKAGFYKLIKANGFLDTVIVVKHEMTNLQANQPFPTTTQHVQRTVYPILLATSFAHLLNDTMQAVIAAIYPLLETSFTKSRLQNRRCLTAPSKRNRSFTHVSLIVAVVFELIQAMVKMNCKTARRPKTASILRYLWKLLYF